MFAFLMQDSFGVLPPVDTESKFTFHASREDSSRLYVKKTIVVGNVSKWVSYCACPSFCQSGTIDIIHYKSKGRRPGGRQGNQLNWVAMGMHSEALSG